MDIKVKIFYPELKALLSQSDDFSVEGNNVGECLRDLVARQPEARNLLFDKQGQLLKHVYVYVNSEVSDKADLSQPIAEKDELIIAVLITGG
jgi:hypothetical protein